MSFDYQIVYKPKMPTDEVVVVNEDGSYTIFINDDLCRKKKLEKIEHALWHITHDDFGKSDVQQIEYDAHKM